MPTDDVARPRAVLTCEDLGQDLERQPLAATRLFRSAGVKISLRAWTELPVDVRWAIATEGARDAIDLEAARALLRHVPIRHLELVGEHATPEDQPLPGVLEGLGLQPSFAQTHWPRLPPFARYVLNVLRNNKRLLWRAFAEISGTPTRRYDGWRGPLAHAEVALAARDPVRGEVMTLLAKDRLLDGRGLLLARAAGVRAARAAGATFDLHSTAVTGAVEVDWAVDAQAGTVLWQAHVSTDAGDFFPVAALAGAATAGLCLLDLLKEFDPEVRLRSVRLVEEEWLVGQLDPEASRSVLGATLVLRR